MKKVETVTEHILERCGRKIVRLVFILTLFCAVGIWNPQEIKAAQEGFWVYSISKDEAKITQYNGGEANVVIPSVLGGKPVTCLGSEAFHDNEYLVTVTIPPSVKKIDGSWWEGCFGDCANLTTVNGLESVEQIGAHAFRNCTALSAVSFGNRLTIIEDRAFKECASLGNVVFPSSLTEIQKEAFYGCNAMTAVTIPQSVVWIGDETFRKCENLKTVSLQASLTDMGNSAFRDCTALTDVSVGEAVRYLGEDSFRGCVSLTNVSLGGGVSSAGSRTFMECTSLRNIVIPKNFRSLPERMFKSCTQLSGVTLNYGLISIGDSAFYGCSALESIEIPNSVTGIGENSFWECPNLTDVFLPFSVTSITNGWYPSFHNDTVSFRCYRGSDAAQFAANNDISCTLLDPVPSSGFSFHANQIDMKVGQMMQVGYTLTPADTTDAIVWESSNPDIISVNAIGEITAKSDGQVTIIATATTGTRLTLTARAVRVPTKISFSRSNRTISVGSSYTQTASVRDNKGTLDVIPVYTSSNPAIATVDANGLVRGISPGEVTITARIESENLSASYKVTVVPSSGSSGNNRPSGSSGNSRPSGSSVKKTINKLKISKSGKVLTVKTIAGAKVKVSAKKSVLGKASKTAKANKKGVAKIKFKKKIKKVKVKVSVSKSGYKTKTQTKKF